MRPSAPFGVGLALLALNAAAFYALDRGLSAERRELAELRRAVAALREDAQHASVPRLPNGSPLFCSDRVDTLASVIADRVKGTVTPSATPATAQSAAAESEVAAEAAPSSEDTRAFDEVSRIVDESTRRGSISAETVQRIRQLKGSSRRPQDFSDLNLRLAAAINRGQIVWPPGVALP